MILRKVKGYFAQIPLPLPDPPVVILSHLAVLSDLPNAPRRRDVDRPAALAC
jgi:hypothetical protein